jgi:hypothetical protein
MKCSIVKNTRPAGLEFLEGWYAGGSGANFKKGRRADLVALGEAAFLFNVPEAQFIAAYSH